MSRNEHKVGMPLSVEKVIKVNYGATKYCIGCFSHRNSVILPLALVSATVSALP